MHESSTLLVFATKNEDGTNSINIYGDPNGLRALANALIKQADVDQTNMTHLGDCDTDHTHYKTSHTEGMLSPSSDEVQVGRTDLRTGAIVYWAVDRIENATSS